MKRFGKKSLLALLPALLVVSLLPGPAPAGTYRDSSHGSNVDRSTIDAKYAAFAKGNCGHCHEQHASLGGSEPIPVAGAASGSLAFATEQNLCFTCHDGAPASTNILASFNKTYRHGKNGASGTDYMTTYDNRHRTGEKTSTAFASANRHAECVDCHNPHKATDANPLLGASGITPSATAAWAEPASFTGPAEVTDADQQYKICYKCHSNWAGFGTGTNQAREFNTANRGYHNIQGLANPPSSDTFGNFNPNYVYKMMPRYSAWGTSTANNSTMNTNLRNAVMRCSDCHGDTDTSPQGIHGSSVRPILKVPAGSPYNKWDNTVAVNNRSDCWCFNCHDYNFTNSSFSNTGNNWHTGKHNKSEAKCMSCHVKVPHGWNDLRSLLKQKNLAAGPYQGTSVSSGIGYPAGATLPNRGGWTENNSNNGSLGHQNCN